MADAVLKVEDALGALINLQDPNLKLEAIRALLAGTLKVDTDVSGLSKEATLDAVRVLLAGTLAVDTGLAQPVQQGDVVLVGNQPADPATETTLAGVLADLAAKRNGDGTEPIFVTPSTVQRVTDAETWAAGAHRIDVSSGNNLWLVLENPAGSGKNVLLGGVTAYTNTNETVWVDVFRDTQPDLAATPLTPWTQNFIAGALGAVSAMTVTHHGSTVADGQQLDAGANLTRQSPWIYQGPPILIGPDSSAGLRLEVPGGLTGGADLSVNALWIETAAA